MSLKSLPFESLRPEPTKPELQEALCKFREVRKRTEEICKPLVTEDYGIQSMLDVSPPKWHLAHTTWFFEEFIIPQLIKNYRPHQDQYRYLFNSYYDTVGPFIERAQRGLLSRPSVDEVYEYRRKIDFLLLEAFENAPQEERATLLPLLILGNHHEQQHQELLLTDIKHIMASNPLKPAYLNHLPEPPLPRASSRKWINFEEGLRQIGVPPSNSSFAFDNESPNHSVYLKNFKIALNLVSCGEYLEFIQAQGYQRAKFWLSDGWTLVQKNRWKAPLYWEPIKDSWWQMTLSGMQPVDENQPVTHISYYEADAYARWRGYRLPTEQEWETAALELKLQSARLQWGDTPLALFPFLNELWQWTQSSYSPYPGYQAWQGALAEYNQKFMCNQQVLRGGSWATPLDHIRPSYRNFFPPDARWQFSGIRLAA